jgi:serine protease
MTKHKLFSYKSIVLYLALPILSTPVFATNDVNEHNGPTTRFIVKYKSSALENTGTSLSLAQHKSKRAKLMRNKAEHFSNRIGETMHFVRETSLERHAVFQAQRKLSGRETNQVLNLLTQDDEIESVEEDMILQPALVPNDTHYTNQWHYFEFTGGLSLPLAWDMATGQGIVTAVLDTGYRPHADLNPNILPGYDMVSDSFMGNDGNGRDNSALDPGDWADVGECGNGQPTAFRASSWHGTHVAGTIAAITNNNSGVAGVAYNAKIVPVRVLGKCGGYTSDIADGIIWASGGSVSGIPINANPAKVINMSLGGTGPCASVTQNAINIARNRGAVIVVAAGNNNADTNNFNPANCAGVINVAATNRSGGRAYYSNYGAGIDLSAPGGAMGSANDPNGVLSTHNTGTSVPGNDSYGYLQGTSMAAPHVAGVAALIKQAKPSATPNQIEDILKSTARSFPGSCNGCGTGIVDAHAAVTEATTVIPPGPYTWRLAPGFVTAICPTGSIPMTAPLHAAGTQCSTYGAMARTSVLRLSVPAGPNCYQALHCQQ